MLVPPRGLGHGLGPIVRIPADSCDSLDELKKFFQVGREVYFLYLGSFLIEFEVLFVGLCDGFDYRVKFRLKSIYGLFGGRNSSSDKVDCLFESRNPQRRYVLGGRTDAGSGKRHNASQSKHAFDAGVFGSNVAIAFSRQQTWRADVQSTPPNPIATSLAAWTRLGLFNLNIKRTSGRGAPGCHQTRVEPTHSIPETNRVRYYHKRTQRIDHA